MHETVHTKHVCMFSMHETMLSMQKTVLNMHSPKDHILSKIRSNFQDEQTQTEQGSIPDNGK